MSPAASDDEGLPIGRLVFRLAVAGLAFYVFWTSFELFRTWWGLSLFGAAGGFSLWFELRGRQRVRERLTDEQGRPKTPGDIWTVLLAGNALSGFVAALVVALLWLQRPSLLSDAWWILLLVASLVYGLAAGLLWQWRRR